MKNYLLALYLLASLVACDKKVIIDTSFKIHPGFEIERICMEPTVIDPVDIVFDEQGRLYVLEMPGYPLSEMESRIVLLEDEDQDGLYEKRSLYAERLRQATSFLRYAGGFLVATPPDLVYLSDTNRDGRADYREILLSGFSEGNLQHNFNGLSYGLDNWIYGANGGNGGEIYWSDDVDQRHNLGAGDFRLSITDRIIQRTGRSAGGFEIAINDYGHYFATHNLYHIRQLVLPDRYYRGQYLNPRHALSDISDHDKNGLARIYAIGDQNTRVNHPEQSGYFSGACGIEHYGGQLFPDEYQGNIFVADVVLNLVHRDIIQLDGPTYKARRGRENVEFLASSDRSFRPVNIKTGSDGALYIVDMYREVIEHPEWIPDELEKKMNLKGGSDRGRIYRIFPTGKKGGEPCTYSLEAEDELIAGLLDDNQICRTMAQQMIVSNKLSRLAPEIRSAYQNASSKARLHLLWTLHGIGMLSIPDIQSALNDGDPRVRENAVILAEHFAEDKSILSQLLKMSYDIDTRVQMQVALSLGVFLSDHANETQNIVKTLIQIERYNPTNKWTRMAVATALNRVPFAAIQSILKEPTSISVYLVRMLTLRLAQVGKLDNITEIMNEILVTNKLSDSLISNALDGIREGLPLGKIDFRSAGIELAAPLNNKEGAKTEIDQAIWRIRKTLQMLPSEYQIKSMDLAKTGVIDQLRSKSERLKDLTILELLPGEETLPVLLKLLQADEPLELQLAAIRLIQKMEGSEAGRSLVQIWNTLSPAVRQVASDILLYRADNHATLLTALENQVLTVTEFNFDLERRRRLLLSKDMSIRQRAEALFTDAGVITRRQALEQMRPALSLVASTKPGEKIFEMQCASCHRWRKMGSEVGPNLTECNRMSKETLLHHILDPNAVAEPSYINHIIELKDGQTLSGILDAESNDAVTVKILGGQIIVVPRNKIEMLTSTGKSYMTEGFESSINNQEMADLLAFLQQRN